MTFHNPEYLNLLLIIPLLIGMALLCHYMQRKKQQKLGDKRLIEALSPESSVWRPHFKRGLILTAVALTVIVLARPQIFGEGGSEKRRGIEVVYMLDVSNSMLADDVHPSRLERAKLLITTLMDRTEGDKIGLGVFAGEAYPQLPITNDYVSAKMFLDNINVNMVSLQGTNLAAAIDLARASFSQEKGVGKAIVVITDGENHEGDAEEAAKKAAKEDKRVYMLGIGTNEGGKIPAENGYLTDESGEVVITKLNTEMCRQIAKAGNGEFITVNNSNSAQDQLTRALRKLQQKESVIEDSNAVDEQFQAVALIILLLLLIEFCVMEIQNPLYRMKWEKKK